MIELRMLGVLDLRDDGRDFETLLSQPKRVAMLTYLCLQKPRGLHRRDSLVALFWPEADAAHARNSLRNAIHALRHTLGPQAIRTRGDEEVGIDPEALWCDSSVFEDHVASGRAEEALALYRGDLLPGFFVPSAPDFERWLEHQRTHLRSLAAKAAKLAAKRRESANRITDAISSARKAVELSSSDERVVRTLIELLIRSGDRSAALKVYDTFAKELKSEFQTKPSPETTALIQSADPLSR